MGFDLRPFQQRLVAGPRVAGQRAAVTGLVAQREGLVQGVLTALGAVDAGRERLGARRRPVAGRPFDGVEHPVEDERPDAGGEMVA